MVVKLYPVKHYVTALEDPPCSPELETLLFPLSATERIAIRERSGGHCKGNENSERGIEKWLSELLPKTWQKCVTAQGTTLQEMLCNQM
jgi:hypothetical protein